MVIEVLVRYYELVVRIDGRLGTFLKSLNGNSLLENKMTHPVKKMS